MIVNEAGKVQWEGLEGVCQRRHSHLELSRDDRPTYRTTSIFDLPLRSFYEAKCSICGYTVKFYEKGE